jgi:hypothetical protein
MEANMSDTSGLEKAVWIRPPEPTGAVKLVEQI